MSLRSWVVRRRAFLLRLVQCSPKWSSLSNKRDPKQLDGGGRTDRNVRYLDEGIFGVPAPLGQHHYLRFLAGDRHLVARRPPHHEVRRVLSCS